MLLLLGADPNAADDRGLTPLHKATLAGVADKLVRYGADLQKTNKEGLTAQQWRQKSKSLFDDELKTTLDGNGPASKLRSERQLMREKTEKEEELKKETATQP